MRRAARAPFALALLVTLLAVSAGAQVPATPPYETTTSLGGTGDLNVPPGGAVEVPVAFSLAVHGNAPEGEVVVRPVAPPAAEGWTLALSPEQVVIPLAPSEDPTLPFQRYEGMFVLRAQPAPGLGAAEVHRVPVRLLAEATTLTQESEGEGEVLLAVEPHPALRVADAPERVGAVLDRWTEVAFTVANEGNVPYDAYVDEIFSSVFGSECELRLPEPAHVPHGGRADLALSFRCTERPGLDWVVLSALVRAEYPPMHAYPEPRDARLEVNVTLLLEDGTSAVREEEFFDTPAPSWVLALAAALTSARARRRA